MNQYLNIIEVEDDAEWNDCSELSDVELNDYVEDVVT